MARIVQKFGGTSVADIERIKVAAEWVKAEVDADHQVAVTVSAMAGVTDELVGYVDMVSSLYDAREYDVVVSAGEQVTSGLLALVLQNIGVDARSWLGWQIPVFTDSAHGKARISRIKETQLVECMEKGQVPVIAGFQGVGMDNRVTTLGRGGTDTSAVALAAAVNADRCDIYTDVDGIYTTDPRIVPTAQKLEKITYEEMLEMASVGAKVLQTRAVEMAMKYNQIVQVRSSFSNKPGTLVVNEEEIVEQELVSGIAYSRDEAKITLVKVLDKPGVAAAIFGPLADASINVDMIVQSVSEDGEATNLTFTVATNDLERTVTTIKSNYKEIGYEKIISDSKVAKVSVVGVGMRTHAGVAQKMFQTLAEKSINIQVISTSEIKVSVLIDEEYTELAVRALHSAYGLDSGQ